MRLFLAYASFPKKPGSHSDQEHYHYSRLIFHVAHDIHWLSILAAIITSSSVVGLILGPTVVVVISVRIVGRETVHRHAEWEKLKHKRKSRAGRENDEAATKRKSIEQRAVMAMIHHERGDGTKC
jgi:hypothetical protein